MAFPNTRWSVVVAAGASEAPVAREAISTLCRAYWRPLFAYARCRGHSEADAVDLVQGFFVDVLERNALARAEPDRGRFRTFLLTAFDNFVRTEKRAERTLKRGGTAITVDVDDPRLRAILPGVGDDPEQAFTRAFALSLLFEVQDSLRAEYHGRGRGRLFDALQPRLAGDDGPPLAEIATGLGMTDNATKVALHRLRKRHAQLLRRRVVDLVASESELDGELRVLIAAVE